MLNKKKVFIAVGLAALLCRPCPGAAGTDGTGSENIAALLELLKAKGVISEEEAKNFLARQEGKGKSATVGEGGRPAISREERQALVEDVSAEIAQRITPYLEARMEQKLAGQEMPEERKKELIDNVSLEVAQRVSPFIEARLDKNVSDKLKEQEMGKADHWANRISFGGDIRLRYQGDYFDQRNSSFLDPSELPSTVVYPQTDRQRARIRVRAGAKAKVNDEVDAVVRVATGNETDPVSTNDTLGDYQTKDSVVFDQAYVAWNPAKTLTAWGGRIPNPWFSTDLVWDSDLNFEGAAATCSRKFGERWGGFATLGGFAVDEFATSTEDKYLYGAQAGVTTKFLEGYSLKLAAAYYDYVNEVGKSDTANGAPLTGFTSPQFLQKGNTLFYLDPGNTKVGLASEFREANFTGKLDITYFDPVVVSLIGDYVKNIGYDKDEVGTRIFGAAEAYKLGGIEETDGFQVGLNVGYPQITDKWQWRTYLYYKHLEADAVLDAFTDSDFHLGGTHAKGWIFGGEVGLGRNVWLNSRWLTSDEISGPQFSVDTLQVDLNVKY